MFRNQYDSDVTIWSPQGRLHQVFPHTNNIDSVSTGVFLKVEYAMEAVKQGSATVGLKSRTHAVLVALKRASSDLSSHQKKILPIDDHVGVSIAGLTADARTISRWMRTECMNRDDLFRLVDWLLYCVKHFLSSPLGSTVGRPAARKLNFISLTNPPM